MPTGVQLSSGVVVGQPIPLDAKFGPYNSTTDALNDIGVGLRYRGLTVGIFVGGVLKEYWFSSGTENSDFVAKSSDVTWDSVLNKPATFTPSTHSHPVSQITNFATEVAAVAPPTTNAGLLTSGTLLDARLSTAVTTSLGKADTASQPGHTHTNATTTVAGFLSTADKTKLDGIATGAQVNTVTSVAGRTGAVTLAVADVTNAVSTTDARLSDSRTPSSTLAHASTHHTGGTDALTPANIGAAPSSHAHAISDVTGLSTALGSKQPSGSYATLVSGTVPASQLPSYVDDVVEVDGVIQPTGTGEAGKIYVTTTNSKIWRWSGNFWIEISASPGSTDAVPEGATNLYHTTGRASAAAPVQSVASRTGDVTLAISDVTNLQNSLDGKQASGSYAASSHVHPIATTSAAGFLSSSDHIKLLTIQTGAEINVNADWTASSGDAAILNKPSTFPPATHTHAISDVTNLQTNLDGKQASGSYAAAISEIELQQNGTTTITTAQLPCRGIAFSDGEGTFTVNLPTPSIRQSGLTFSIKSQYEAGAGPNFITVVHNATNLFNNYELDEAQGSIDFAWDGYEWSYSSRFNYYSVPSRILTLPTGSGVFALTSNIPSVMQLTAVNLVLN